MFKKIVQFSHNDLDGYACNVVTKTIAEILERSGKGHIRLEFHNCDYGSINDVIVSRLRTTLKCEVEETLFIVSDISWSSDEITHAFKNLDWFVFADHHKSSEKLADMMAQTNVAGHRLSVSKEGNVCGAIQLLYCLEELLFDNGFTLFSDNPERMIDLCDFLDIVNSWDLWTWTECNKSSKSTNAYDLLNNIGPTLNAYLDFFQRDVTGNDVHKFTDYMVDMILNPIENDFKTNLGRCMSDTNGFKEYLEDQARLIEISCNLYLRVPFTVPFGPDIETLMFMCPVGIKNKSLVSLLAYNKIKAKGIADYDCLAIYEIGSDTVSLRYPSRTDIDLSRVAKYNNFAVDETGGGHPFAAGFPVEGKQFTDSILTEKKLWKL